MSFANRKDLNQLPQSVTFVFTVYKFSLIRVHAVGRQHFSGTRGGGGGRGAQLSNIKFIRV